MKLEKLHLSGFGALAEVELGEIGPGLNVIEGANEAGKTTLLEFVRALFFGFLPRGNARRYEPASGVAHGGWAVVQNRHGEQLRIERTPGTSSGNCTVKEMGGEREINLDVFLGGADRPLYEQIFAFSLDELSGLSASGEQMEKRVYAASSGSQGHLLLNALQNTRQTADEIYRKRGSNPPLNKAMSEYKKLQEEVRRLSRQIETYNEDRTQFLEQQQSAKDFGENFKAAERELAVAKLHHDVWETWVKLAGLRGELQELPEQPEFSEAVAAEMERLRTARRQCGEEWDKLKPRLERVEKNLQDCRVDGALLQNAAAINLLKERLGMYESNARALPLLQQKLENTRQHITARLEQLGLQWDEARIKKIDMSREPRQRIQQFENDLNKLQKIRDDALQAETATARQLEQQQKSIQRLREEITRDFPQEPPANTVLTQQVEALRHADELLRREEEAQTRRHFLNRNLEEHYIDENKQASPAATVIFSPLWGLLPLALAVIIAGALHHQPLLAVLIAACFVIFAGLLFWMGRQQKAAVITAAQQDERRAAQGKSDLLHLQQEVQACEEQVAQARAQLQQVALKWGWVLENHADLQKISGLLQRNRENRLRYENGMQDVKRREGDREQIGETQKQQREEIVAAKNALERAESEWNGWLQERDLPVTNSPQQALQLFDSLQNVRDELRGRDEHQQQLDAKEREQQEFTDQAGALWKKMELPQFSISDLPATVRGLWEELEQQKKQVVKRDGLVKEQQEWLDHQAMQQKRGDGIEKEIRDLLVHTAAADEKEFDCKTQIFRQRAEMEKEMKAQVRILETHSAPGPACLALEHELEKLDAQQVQERWKNAGDAHQQAKEKLLAAQQQQGEWSNRVRQLEENEGQLTALLRRLEEQKTVIADLAAQWAVARTTHLLLERTRARFEKERQPAVIKRAGALMSGVTAGRYQMALASNGLSAVELDEGERGRKPLAHWSRGTREQFYLALRLAFIEDYCNAEHLEPLPVVMDDVLVHADGYRRLAAASAMIAEFAHNHQVLYFTCRPGDAEVLCEAAPTARRLRLEQGKFISHNEPRA